MMALTTPTARTCGRRSWTYTQSWLSAHISDADAIGKPLIVEEFGKAVSAKKVYTGELPHSLQPGEYPRDVFCPATVHECLMMPLAHDSRCWCLLPIGF